MEPQSDLAASGLLYEGNFESWKAHMDTVLRIQGAVSFDNTIEMLFMNWAESRRVASIIRSYVSPQLLNRVPRTYCEGAYDLTRWLKRLAIPFRFLDLPVELRYRVYECVLGDIDLFYTVPPRKCYSAITKVSHQIRDEVLPVFCARSIFYLDFVGPILNKDDVYCESNNVDIAAAVRRWADGLGSHNLKHLRKVCMALRVQWDLRPAGVEELIEFFFAPTTGLGVASLPCLNEKSKTLLMNHIATTEENRKVFNMQGESIIMALISNPELWKYGILQAI